MTMKWQRRDNPPAHQMQCLVLATNEAYQFGHPQLLTAFYQDKYYDTPLDRFYMVGAGYEGRPWKVIAWAELRVQKPIWAIGAAGGLL